MQNLTFGKFLKEVRLDRGFTLRAFARSLNKDAGNISKIERGKLPPPDEKNLKEYAKVLDLEESSQEYKNLVDLAFVEIKKVPEYACSDEDLIKKLPILFRTATGSKVARDKFDKLVEELRKL